MFTVYYADCDLNLVVPHTKYKHFNYINVATIIRKKTGSGLHIKKQTKDKDDHYSYKSYSLHWCFDDGGCESCPKRHY